LEKKPLVAIVGPTAVGKSALAIELAAMLDGEIVSADSMQVYKGMDIGTAKLTEEEMVASNGIKIPHHLIDFLSPTENFNVAEYQNLAREKIAEIHEKGKIPFLVGGTGLYINAVIDKYDFENSPVNEDLRKRLWEEAQENGNLYIYEKLKKVDPITANKLHPNNLKRIIRALEYYYSTGKLFSQKKITKKESIYKLAMIGLNCERSVLYDKINKRVELMLKNGLVDEVKMLLDKGVTTSYTAMQGLGYKQIAQYLRGEISYEEAVRRLKRDTRHFAKRQLTWFRRDERIIWYEVNNNSRIIDLAKKIKLQICRIINMKC
jgi:tRNA dimethylallyltransferase